MTEFPDTRRLVRSSLLWRWSGQAQALLTRAAQSSAVAVALRRAAESSGALDAGERLRLGAIAIALAASVQGVVHALAPATVMTSLPGLWLTAALMAGTIAASAPSLVQAWPSSRCRAALMAARARIVRRSNGR